MSILVLDDSNYWDVVANTDGPLFVNLYAETCKHCQKFHPKLIELEEEFEGEVTFAKIDLINNPEVKAKLGVNQFPTNYLYQNHGEVLHSIVGGLPKATLKFWITSYINPLLEASTSNENDQPLIAA